MMKANRACTVSSMTVLLIQSTSSNINIDFYYFFLYIPFHLLYFSAVSFTCETPQLNFTIRVIHHYLLYSINNMPYLNFKHSYLLWTVINFLIRQLFECPAMPNCDYPIYATHISQKHLFFVFCNFLVSLFIFFYYFIIIFSLFVVTNHFNSLHKSIKKYIWN